MEHQPQSLHRRKSSKETDENAVIILPPPPPPPPPSVVPTTSNVNGLTNGSTKHAFPSPLLAAPPAPRNRVRSTPVGHSRSMSTASATMPSQPMGPFRNSFSMNRHQNGISNGLGLPPTSPFKSSFQLGPAPPGHGHARTRSVSAFAPPSPSPLSASFPVSASANDAISTSSGTPTTHVFPTSASAPEQSPTIPAASPISLGFPPKNSRRHSRLHSRNLSVFFPRPGSLPHTAIAEDGTQEFELGLNDTKDEEAPVSDIPSAEPNVSWKNGRHMSSSSSLRPPLTPLGIGFTFGSRPPPPTSSSSATSSPIEVNGNLPVPPPMRGPSLSSSSTSSISSRRGHHHKHSLSHNFFSFLEPGANGHLVSPSEELHTQPTPTPVSPWTKLPPLSDPDDTKPVLERVEGDVSPPPGSSPVDVIMPGERSQLGLGLDEEETRAYADHMGSDRAARAVSLGQFMLGAWLWVVGQQVGSLGCTGLGYWVVFDALGVGIGKVLPGRWLTLRRGTKEGGREKVRRPYGNARVETVMMFVQAVYLMFSSVYVCKETVEHVLLSAGSGGAAADGHHHHHQVDADEGVLGISFPIILLFITLISLIGTAVFYDNHARLVNVTDNRIPSLSALIRSLSTSSQRVYHEPPPTTLSGIILSNPYIASPMLFSSAILFVALCMPPSQHQTCDLLIAAVITVITFNLAYRACTVLGTVLLQTAPARGLSGGKMESFLRAMRDVERHPQVLHLPAPHIWQVAPTGPSDKRIYSGNGIGRGSQANSLVVTMELHVKHDLGDDDVLKLTRWAWERCMIALGGSDAVEKSRDGCEGDGGPEVTVGVVRG
ncbi:hypothetical protein AX17_006739 [Amanita inopinata Kibby_2008]|nr:hypothetical protein AX17_006739 [Amanita inopinata Kibby_2008]